MNGTLGEEGQGPSQSGPPPGFGTPPGGCLPPMEYMMTPPQPGYYANVTEQLWRIFPPIIILFGTFGNTLTVLILLRQSRKLSSTALFLLTLAISDTLFLLNAPLRRWIIAVWEVDVRDMSSVGCKFSVYLTYSSYQFSSWILVMVTVERFISNVRPHHVRIGCTPRLAATVILALFILIFGLNTHIFYGFGRPDLPPEYGEQCIILHEGYQKFWDKIYSWIDLAVVYAVPFLILLIANSFIIYKLRQSRITRRRLSVMRTQVDKTHSKDTKLISVMLILLSVVFFICLTPVSVFFVYRPYWVDNIAPMMCTDFLGFIEANEMIMLVHAITNIIGYINAAFNFVLYVMSGSKFRAELKSLFLCRPGHGVGIFGGSSSTRRQLTYTTQTSSRHGSQRSVSSVNADPRASISNGTPSEQIVRQHSNPAYETEEKDTHDDADKPEIIAKTRL